MGKSKKGAEASEDAPAAAKQMCAIAQPLADDKLKKKVLKLAKKAAKKKQVKRGVKEVVKALRKNVKGYEQFSISPHSRTPVNSSGFSAISSGAYVMLMVTPYHRGAARGPEAGQCPQHAACPMCTACSPAVPSLLLYASRLCIIAGDISPIDVITPLPIMCEDRDVPYVYIDSKEVRAPPPASPYPLETHSLPSPACTRPPRPPLRDSSPGCACRSWAPPGRPSGRRA